jgi:hypothetical protein
LGFFYSDLSILHAIDYCGPDVLLKGVLEWIGALAVSLPFSQDVAIHARANHPEHFIPANFDNLSCSAFAFVRVCNGKLKDVVALRQMLLRNFVS